jgi:hypothetical protein
VYYVLTPQHVSRMPHKHGRLPTIGQFLLRATKLFNDFGHKSIPWSTPYSLCYTNVTIQTFHFWLQCFN